MSFNFEKCKVMHTGNINLEREYTMRGKKLTTMETEKDIGVNISKNLKPTEQCRKTAAKAT
jgi:hypothetical protein